MSYNKISKDLNNISNERNILKKNAELIDAATSETSDEITVDKTLTIQKGSLNIGSVITLSEGTSSLLVSEKIDGSISAVIASTFTSAGSSNPSDFFLDAEAQIDVQTTDTTNITTNPLSFNFNATADRQANKITFKTFAAMSNVRAKVTHNSSGIVVQYIPSKAIYDAGTGGYDMIKVGDNIFNFIDDLTDDPANGLFYLPATPFRLINGDQYDIEIAGDSVNLKGNASSFPYMIVAAQTGVNRAIGFKEYSDRVQTTGLLEGGVVSQATSTTVDWTSGHGIVADFSDPEAPIVTDVEWDAVSGQSVTAIGTDGTTLFGYDATGSVVQKLSTAIAIDDAHDTIWFGSATHLSGSIVSVITAPGNLAYDGLGSFSDFINLVIGPANVDGNVYDANGTNMNIDVVGGNAYMMGSNFRINPALSDIVTLANDTTVSFQKVYRSAGAGLNVIYDGAATTTIDPGSYDDGTGTLATTTTDYWTIQRIFRGRTGNTFVAYGQEEFATKADALTALGKESFVEKSPLPFMMFRCSLVVQKGAADLSDTAEAEFFAQSSFRLVGAQSASASIPGVTNPGGSDTSIQFNDGGTFGGDSNFTYVTAPLYNEIHMKPPDSSGSAGFIFNNSGGANRGTFAYGQIGNELLYTVNAATSGGLRWVNNSEGDLVFDNQDTSTKFDFIATNHTHTHPMFTIGTSSGATDWHVGTINPQATVEASGGTFYFRDAETDSGLYVKRSTGSPSSTGWYNFVGSSSTSVDNALATWDGTAGNAVQSIGNAILTDNESDLLLALNTPADGGSAEIIIYDDDSSERIKISHNDGGGGPDSTQIYMEALTNEIVGSGIEFTVRADNGDLLLHADTATKSVELKSAGADTNPVIKIEAEGTNGVEVDFYTGDRTPVGNVTASPGDYYFRSDGADSDIYIHTGASSDNTSWVDILASSAGTGDVVGPSSSVTNAIATFSDTTGKLIGSVDKARIISGGNNTTLHMEAISPTGSADISLYDNTPTLQALIGFDSDDNQLNIMAIESGSILIQSEDNLTLRAGHAASAPLLKLENDTEAINVYVYDGNPNGTISSLEGSLVVDTTSGGSQLFHQQGSGSGSSYAQIESFQKKYANVNTTSSLSRNFNRILLNPTSDITITIPTNGSTAQADGFEQAILKTVANDNVITVNSPGFIAGSGNYVMSRQGDSVTYLQTSSSNHIVNERRDVYAAMSFSGSESVDGAGSGVDVEIDVFTSNDHFYYGLCEPNYAQNRIDFPDVEDLINGDLYEINLNIVAKWENNYDVHFNSSVYDKGLWYDYPIHMYETSSSDNDYQQLNGQGTFRTGVNATAPGLDTYLTLVMRLSSNADITFKSINMYIKKLGG